MKLKQKKLESQKKSSLEDLRKVGQGWEEVLGPEFEKLYFKGLEAFLETEREKNRIFPEFGRICYWSHCCHFKKIRVVILGQDPYHGAGQATGLAFSVHRGKKVPPSLRNIYKKLEQDLGIAAPNHGCLDRWAEQGVLLLNTTLTVREGKADSHSHIGWQQFTDQIIRSVSMLQEKVVFMLWGNNAQKKAGLVDEKRHLVLKAAHPSPLSARRGFVGCKHFSLANEYLEKEIDWRLGSSKE